MKRLILDVRNGSGRSQPPANHSRERFDWQRLPTPAGMNEPGSEPRFRELMERARVFADVGAAEGFFSLSLLRHTGARVFAFESADCFCDLFVDHLEVDGDSADANAAREWGPVLLKIEVEGEEHEVLEGARDILTWPGTSVLVKVHDSPTESRCLRLLESLGFGVDIVGPAWWRRSFGQDGSGSDTWHWLVGEKAPALA